MLPDSLGSFPGAEHSHIAPSLGDSASPFRDRGHELGGIVRLITCGSVDDGKSTLIGRLLWDASPLYDDQRERLLKEAATLNGAKRPDFSRLLDGLIAEQEQGITIDIAWHFFDTASRRFIIIDAPGHEQYTRNMATGASHADVAVLLVDAQSGIKLQTRRHLAILDLVGVRNIVLAVNKMDRIEWSETRFNAIAAEFHELANRFPALRCIAIPVSALCGDNVATLSANMSWYGGPTLLKLLEAMFVQNEEGAEAERFRMPVQMILRDGEGFRGLAGTVTAGSISVGDEVIETRSGLRSRVRRIRTMDGDRAQASGGQAITIELADEIDIGRGGLLAAPAKPALAARHLSIRLVWLANQSYNPGSAYILRTGTDIAPVIGLEIEKRLNLDTLEQESVETCEPNSICLGSLELARPIAIDLFREQRRTGSFMLVDALTGAAVAGGVITGAKSEGSGAKKAAFVLTREMLDRGLCADLAINGDDQAEFSRRANEVAILMRAAGVPVEIAD